MKYLAEIQIAISSNIAVILLK